MKNILEDFLEALEIKYTRRFANTLYQEHPHKFNMFGLKNMLSMYGVKSMGVCCDNKNLLGLNYPCILHIHNDFVVGLDCDADTITYLNHGKKLVVGHEEFKKTWTGNALVVEESTDAKETDYKEHKREELVSTVKTYSIPLMLIIATFVGIVQNYDIIGGIGIFRIALSFVGVLICSMLLEKQLLGESHYGDIVCSMFNHTDCNSILEGPKAKVFGISWSEIGLGYFMANILLISLYPISSSFIAAMNWVAMLYGIWSIYYQWRVAKSWCMLCIMSQIIIWIMGIMAIFSYNTLFIINVGNYILSCMIFAISIIATHKYAAFHIANNEREHALQQYCSLKANKNVAKLLIESEESYRTTFDDSSIVFGNPKARLRVTILSNPHCTPCARLHKQVERLLNINADEICVQYIFFPFHEQMEDSCRYLVYIYKNSNKGEALHRFSIWYDKERFNHENITKTYIAKIHTQEIEEEVNRHRKWRKKTSIIETPTILINGYKLPKEYELGDFIMFNNMVITEKNILQDINGRSTTPLGAELQTAEETV